MARSCIPTFLMVHSELPGLNGYEACHYAACAAPDVPTILLTAEDSAIGLQRALRAGARATVSPDASADTLQTLVAGNRALRECTVHAGQYQLITDPRVCR